MNIGLATNQINTVPALSVTLINLAPIRNTDLALKLANVVERVEAGPTESKIQARLKNARLALITHGTKHTIIRNTE